MKNKKFTTFVSLLGTSMLILGNTNINLFSNNRDSSHVTQIENANYKNLINTIEKNDELLLNTSITRKQKSNKTASNTHNASTSGNNVLIPYDIGKYVPYHPYSANPIYENERQRFEIYDERRNWSPTTYDLNQINGNLYEYTGEYRNIYSLNKRTTYLYERPVKKKVTYETIETKYHHHYRGNRWWNCILTKTFISNSQYNYPYYNNYNYTGYTTKTKIKKHSDTITITESSGWRTSKPLRWFGAEWELVDTRQEQSLNFDEVLKWNPTATQGFTKLKPININKNNFYGLHLAQWNDISNVKKNNNPNWGYSNSRTDYFYIDCAKFIDEIYRATDRIIDVYKDEIFEKKIKADRIRFISELILTGLSTINKLKVITGVLSIISLLDAGIDVISNELGSERKRVDEIGKSRERLYKKLTRKNLEAYKYCVFKVDHYGIDLDFVDKRNNKKDDVKEISLSYKANKKINKNVSKYSDKNFTHLFGYPTLFNTLDYFSNESLSIFSKHAPKQNGDLDELINKLA